MIFVPLPCTFINVWTDDVLEIVMMRDNGEREPDDKVIIRSDKEEAAQQEMR